MNSRAKMGENESAAKSWCSAGNLLAWCLILGAISFQVWLLPAHWINADEGPHLMDARLARQGLVPQVDFDSRGPLYTYSYVPAFLLFGDSLVSGRMVPLAATWIGALLVFMIGIRMWDATRGGMAAVLFLLTPTILVNAPVAKMEPLAVMVTSMGMYALLMHLRVGRAIWLVASGVAFGAAYYVRESTIAGALGVGLVLLIFTRPIRACVPKLALFGGGMAIVCLGVVLWYSIFVPVEQILRNDQLFPVARAWSTISEVVARAGTTPADVPPDAAHSVPKGLEGLRLSPQSLSSTFVAIVSAVKLNAALVFGSILACVWLLRSASRWLRRERPEPGDERSGIVIAAVWLGVFAAIYGYYAIKRGFFQFYFREFIPPMALLTAWVVHRAVQRLGAERQALFGMVASVALSVAAYFVQTYAGAGGVLLAVAGIGLLGALWGAQWLTARHRALRFAGGVAVVGLALVLIPWGPDFGSMERFLDWAVLGVVVAVVTWLFQACYGSPDRPCWRSFGVLAALAALAAGTSAYGVGRLGPGYNCDWPPSVLAQVVDTIKRVTAPHDSVISGAVIWEFEAGRPPFAMLTHPLALRDSLRRPVPARVLDDLSGNPPRLIILDGFTEQTYLRRIPAIAAMLKSDYTLIEEVLGANYPVAIYLRIEQPTNAL